MSDAYGRETARFADPARETAVGKCAAKRAPCQVPDVERESEGPDARALLHEGVRAVLAVLLLREERVIGGLRSGARSRASSPSVVTLLQALSSQSVLAIQNARLFREIEEEGKAAGGREPVEVAVPRQHVARTAHAVERGINGVTEMLHEDAVDLAERRSGAAGARAARAASDLLALINDILDPSQGSRPARSTFTSSSSPSRRWSRTVQTIATMATKNDNKVVVECPADLGSTMNADQTRDPAGVAESGEQRQQVHRARHGDHQRRARNRGGREWVTMAWRIPASV
ncbi:MAG: GAF domain-containing protein [Betaproteobacteria bacterium]|nr:GAF domain-containing protein [Betaproteobacteria bacterium]